MKKNRNIDDWVEETIEKAIQAGKLYELIFSERGKHLIDGYPKPKLQKMVLRSLRKMK